MLTHLLPLLNTSDLFGVSPRWATSLLRNAKLDNVVALTIKMVVLGALVAGLRRALAWLSYRIERALFSKAYIAATDASYLWVTAWIAQDPAAQRQISDFQLSTSEWRQVRKKSGNALVGGAVGEQNATWSSKEIIGQVIPVYHQSIRIKHNGTYLWISRRVASFAQSKLRSVDHIQIKTIAIQPNAIKDFLVTAHQAFFAKEETELLIFHAKRINPTWQKPVSRPARPWSSVILPGTVKEDLLRDMERFLSEKEMSWYAARGIPHRRGYLFHGAPGAGKTTLATAIASKLRLDIYVINPAQRGMDDAKLSKLFRDCPARSIILIEDIDCIFPRGRNGRQISVGVAEDSEEADVVETVPEAEGASSLSSPRVVGGSHDLAPSTVTLSGLLNAIDGVSSQEGCILIASTNHPERLDPALVRAGRFDVPVAFSNAIPAQAKALFLHFYPLADFTSTDSRDLVREKRIVGIETQHDLDELGEDFASAVLPDQAAKAQALAFRDVTRGISMAALQGYLLKYKDDPVAAAAEARGWAEEISEDRLRAVATRSSPPAASGGKTLTVTSTAVPRAAKRS